MRNRRVMTVVMCLALAGSASARQRSSDAAGDGDAKEIASYRLTMPVLQKMIVAAKTMAAAIRTDPTFSAGIAAEKELDALQSKDNPTPADTARIEALQKQVDALEESASGGQDDDARTLGDMERKIAAIPHMSEALRSAGLSAREFATFEMSALQAGLAAGLEQAGHASKTLPAGIQPANVQFMKDHEKDFEALSQAMQGVGQ